MAFGLLGYAIQITTLIHMIQIPPIALQGFKGALLLVQSLEAGSVQSVPCAHSQDPCWGAQRTGSSDAWQSSLDRLAAPHSQTDLC